VLYVHVIDSLMKNSFLHQTKKPKKKKKNKKGPDYWIEEAEQGDVNAQVLC